MSSYYVPAIVASDVVLRGGWMHVGRLLAAVLVWATPAVASAADCAGVFKFVANDRLSIQEFSRIADSESKDGPNDSVLVASVADWEDVAYRDKWDLWGVVYATYLEEGAKVAGGTLWVKNRELFGTGGGSTFKTAKDGVRLTILPVTPIKGCKGGFTFRLDPQGRLFANGALVGRAKDVTEK